MHHSFIDQYSNLNSAIHRIDTPFKIIIFFSLIIAIVLTPLRNFSYFIFYAAVVLLAFILSKLPFKFVFYRSLAVIPFVIAISIFLPFMKEDGWFIFWSILLKSYLSALSLIILNSSTKFNHLLKGFQRLKVSKIIIMILSFMYRYIFLILDELMRLNRAKNSRFPKIKKSAAVKILSNMVGMLFIRSYERAERVYLAMCSRGFAGEINTLESNPK